VPRIQRWSAPVDSDAIACVRLGLSTLSMHVDYLSQYCGTFDDGSREEMAALLSTFEMDLSRMTSRLDHACHHADSDDDLTGACRGKIPGIWGDYGDGSQ
jgi:hypothetical protein